MLNIRKKYIAFLGDLDLEIYAWIRCLNNIDPIEINDIEDDDHSESIDNLQLDNKTQPKDCQDDNLFRLEPKSNIVIITITEEIYYHRRLGKAYLEQCKQAVALFYDITNQNSFNRLDNYVEIIHHINPPPNIILVGTHADAVDKEKLVKVRDEAKQKAKEIAWKIFPDNPDKEIKTIEVSAKDPGCHHTCSVTEFKNLVNKMVNYDFTVLIATVLGAGSGGTGSYYGGHAITHHHASMIISFFTVIGTIVTGGFSGITAYIAKQPSFDDDSEKQKPTLRNAGYS